MNSTFVNKESIIVWVFTKNSPVISVNFWESMLSPLITELYTYLYLPWGGGGLSISNFSPPNVQGYTLSWEVLNEHAFRKEKRGSLLQ